MIFTKPPLTPEQLNIVSSLAERSGVSFEIAKILYARGVDTVSKVRRFMSPGKQHFVSPFLMKGMRETIERITAARDNGETVVIYGDYDADGICATSIMFHTLTEFGVNAYPVIPERSDGYGLTEKLIDEVMEEINPDLIITVDCGISGHDEVEYIKDLGVDVIVTDHHELPEVLPDCTVVNCKIKDQEYAFDGLCGAGVAFKIAVALIGEKAYKYLDFAALATVADSMPLIDENRDIVYEGLKLIFSSNARDSFKILVEAANIKEKNSTALAYSLAPKINAAGRMGNAHCALDLFLSDSKAEIYDLAAQLMKYNMQRQAECDELYSSARKKLLKKGPFKRVILLEDEGWKNGLVGIVAARLVEEFTRPVILFVNSKGILHGSARSLEEINILDAISNNKEFLLEYGGHSQAAGVSLKEENLQAFEDALDSYISEKYSADVFVPKQEAEDYIDGEFSLSLAKEIYALEPFGTGNKKPLFAIEVENLDPQPFKENSPHLSIHTDIIDLTYFNGATYSNILRSSGVKTLVFEPNISVFNGKEYLRGNVKSFETKIIPGKELGLELFMYNIRNLCGKGNGQLADYISQDEIKNIVNTAEKCPYGTLYVVSNLKTLDSFPELKELPVSMGAPSLRNFANCVVLVLNSGDIAGFKRIVYLDNPVYSIRKLRSIEVYVNKDIAVKDMLPQIDATREGVGEVFNALKNFGGIQASSSAELYGAIGAKVPYITRYQFVFGVEVLVELGIFSFENNKLIYNRGVKNDLSSSRIYTSLGGKA